MSPVTRLYVYACLYTHLYTRLYTCLYTRLYTCLYTGLYTRLYACLYTCPGWALRCSVHWARHSVARSTTTRSSPYPRLPAGFGIACMSGIHICPHMHFRTYTPTPACTRTHAHARSLVCSHAPAHTCTLARTLAHTCACSLARSRACTHTYTYVHRNACKIVHVLACAHGTNAHACTQCMWARTHGRMHKHRSKEAHARTQTNVQTCAHACIRCAHSRTQVSWLERLSSLPCPCPPSSFTTSHAKAAAGATSLPRIKLRNRISSVGPLLRWAELGKRMCHHRHAIDWPSPTGVSRQSGRYWAGLLTITGTTPSQLSVGTFGWLAHYDYGLENDHTQKRT